MTEREFLEHHLDSLKSLAVELRRRTRGYTRGLVWEPDEGDWCIHRDPLSGKEILKMVWTVCEYDESHAIPNHRTLVFRISFPEHGYDEEIDEAEIGDCLWLPSSDQLIEWLDGQGCGIELVRIGGMTEVRALVGVPSITEVFQTPRHALMSTVLAVLSQPRVL